MSVLRTAALQALGDAIALATDLTSAHILGEEPGAQGGTPCLVIQPIGRGNGAWTFESSDEDEVEGAAFSSQQLYQIGEYHGDVELIIIASNAAERERLEEQILHYFLSREGSPGTQLVTTQPGVQVGTWLTLCEAPAVFTLDKTEWNEIEAFNKRRKARIVANCRIPALIVRNDIYTLDEYVLVLQNDLTATAATESVQIAEDGGISPYP